MIGSCLAGQSFRPPAASPLACTTPSVLAPNDTIRPSCTLARGRRASGFDGCPLVGQHALILFFPRPTHFWSRWCAASFPLMRLTQKRRCRCWSRLEVSPLLLATPSRLEARRSDFDSRLLARSAVRDWRRRARLANSICQRKIYFRLTRRNRSSSSSSSQQHA